TATAKVRLELSGEHPVRQVVAEWTRLDLPASPIVVERFRGADEGPFEFELPVGRYRLRLDAARRAERRDTFLVARHHELDLPATGAAATLQLDHGGRVRVLVRDASGAWSPGIVRLLADGAEA